AAHDPGLASQVTAGQYQGIGLSGGQAQQQQQTKRKQLSRAITGAVTHGGLIQITSAAHGFNTEDRITITGVGGTVEANGNNWRITVTGANTFDLQGSTFTN